MSERFRQNALRILKSVYYMKDPKKITKEHKKNKVSGDEFVDVLLYLKRKGLVNYEKLEIPMEINLTDKGMEYIVSELKQEKQERFNEIVAFTGGILALIGIYDFIIKSTNLIPSQQSYWIITFIFLGVVMGCLGPLVVIIIDFWKKEVFGK